ncbi:hypothetical protein [Krasilnikovia sp. MM14-A1259]|uniref:hypothetical protein n=1 Tax=Krasilnikovia sp. MM14-A1259 TaxID=3373539 RepID=UPI00381817F9
MFGKLEALGSRILSRFVPQIDAAACGWKHWDSCWQCKGKPCSVDGCTAKLYCG